MSAEMKFTRSQAALEKFMECLQCRKCNKLAENPVRFVTCAHFFCIKCVPKFPESCVFCGVPVPPNDVKTDFMVEGLIKSSSELYNLLSQKQFGKNEIANKNKEKDDKNKKKIDKSKEKVEKTNENSDENVENKINKNRKSKRKPKKKSNESDTASVTSTLKSSKLNDSKESLFTEPEDLLVLSKHMLQRMNKPNRKGEVPLHTACVKGDVRLVKALLNAGANPNTKDNANNTALQEAASYGFYEICSLLLESGALPNTAGDKNQTALHAAVISNHVRIAELLLTHGASLNARDEHGKTPKDYCKSEEMDHILISTADKNDEISQCNASLNATVINATLDFNPVVVYAIDLDKENVESLREAALYHKFNIVSKFRNEVTHIVVKTINGCANLSYEICLAILNGMWIMPFEWIMYLLDHKNSSDIDLSLFEVSSISHTYDTPHKARENAQQQNPRLFNNCTFFFALNNRSSYNIGNMELTKDQIINLAIVGEGKIIKRSPNPDLIEDTEIVPYHVSDMPDHPLFHCTHYVVYEPGKDEPKMKYNMKNLKTLPLLWFIESIENFKLMDPINYGLMIDS